jgi:SAM-dependent methyltransferase
LPGVGVYAETHGDPSSLLRYRLSLIHERAHFQPTDVVLEIGCGNGLHLLALADSFGRGIGIDLSPAMLRVARRHVTRSPWQGKLQFTVDLAEQLSSVADASIDVIFSVGALEHMLDKRRVIANAFRVLKPGGRFICLTPNGHYLWYRWLASLFEWKSDICPQTASCRAANWIIPCVRRAFGTWRSATGHSFHKGICSLCMLPYSTSSTVVGESPPLTACAVAWWYGRSGMAHALDGDSGSSGGCRDLGPGLHLQACRAWR